MPIRAILTKVQVLRWFVATAFIAGLVACNGLSLTGGQASGEPTIVGWRPPTIVAPTLLTPTPTLLPSSTPARSSPAPVCSNNLSFLKDLTIPDGSSVAPNAPLDKRWLVKNSGTCNWDARYQLRLTSGTNLGALPEQALYPARSGAQAPLRLLFHAPESPGVYRSSWQAIGADGQPFGDPVFIEIIVKN
jgi:hypothetical protein